MSDSAANPEEISRLPLRDLGLKPGMAVQTRRLVEGAHKTESQFFGAIEGKGVMVGPMGPDGTQTGLEAGEICVVRGFTGQYEYSFLTKVLQTFEKPFVYALLAYPAAVDARLVRKSMRIKAGWPASVSITQQDGSVQVQKVDLIDFSVQGAMVRASNSLAAIGANLQLTLSVKVEDEPQDLRLTASVCHNNRARYEDVYFVGMAFKALSQQDKLVLTYLTQTA